MLLLVSCESDQVNWNSTFDTGGKEPYGTYLAYHSLKHYYPKAGIQKVNSNFNVESIATYDNQSIDGINALVMVGLDMQFTDEELWGLYTFLEEGNVAIISTNQLSPNFKSVFSATVSSDYNTLDNNNLQIRIKEGEVETFEYLTPRIGSKVVLHNISDEAFYGYFANEPNLACLSVGDGLLLVHGAPYSFTNFYLLNKNKKYFETLMGLLPNKEIGNIIFSSHPLHNASDSSLSVLMKYPPLKWAIYLTVFLAIIYLFFEMKRRQRIVPIVPAPENNTAKFIQTMGKLYYNHANHTNLAQKKIVYFLEFVRINYYISTQFLDDDFVQRLHIKSGQSLEEANQLITNIKLIQSGFEADDAFLIQLDQQIKLFTNGRQYTKF